MPGKDSARLGPEGRRIYRLPPMPPSPIIGGCSVAVTLVEAFCCVARVVCVFIFIVVRCVLFVALCGYTRCLCGCVSVGVFVCVCVCCVCVVLCCVVLCRVVWCGVVRCCVALCCVLCCVVLC